MVLGRCIAKNHAFLKARREEKTDDVLKSIILIPKAEKKGLLLAVFLFHNSFSYQSKEKKRKNPRKECR